MRERRRLIIGENSNKELEWIILGTTRNSSDLTYHVHYQTANVGFDHPIYGFAVLTTGELSVNWSHYINFSWYPSTISETTTETFTAWSVTYTQRGSTKLDYYSGAYSSSNNETYTDIDGNTVSSGVAIVTSLPDIIKINNSNVNSYIKWILDRPKYLSKIQAGYYNIQNFAILVDTTTPRISTNFVY